MKRFGLLHGVAALAVAAILGCGATVAGEGEGEESEGAGEVEQSISGGGGCCSMGYYFCPSTGDTYDYGVPGCDNGGTRPRMGSACNAACASACVDSGWHNGC